MARKKETSEATGRYAYDGLDRLLHEKARLGILTSLVTNPEGLRFNDLKEFCALTDGNLSRHLQMLNEAGLVEVWKSFEGRRPQTLARISTGGRKRFLEYLAALEQVLKDAVPETRRDGSALPLPRGWAPA